MIDTNNLTTEDIIAYSTITGFNIQTLSLFIEYIKSSIEFENKYSPTQYIPLVAPYEDLPLFLGKSDFSNKLIKWRLYIHKGGPCMRDRDFIRHIDFSEDEIDILRRTYRSIYSRQMYGYGRFSPDQFPYYPSGVICILQNELPILKKIITVYPQYIINLFDTSFEQVPLIIAENKSDDETEYYDATIKWRLSLGK